LHLPIAGELAEWNRHEPRADGGDRFVGAEVSNHLITKAEVNQVICRLGGRGDDAPVQERQNPVCVVGSSATPKGALPTLIAVVRDSASMA
jgi:hypothetical protein